MLDDFYEHCTAPQSEIKYIYEIYEPLIVIQGLVPFYQYHSVFLITNDLHSDYFMQKCIKRIYRISRKTESPTLKLDSQKQGPNTQWREVTLPKTQLPPPLGTSDA